MRIEDLPRGLAAYRLQSIRPSWAQPKPEETEYSRFSAALEVRALETVEAAFPEALADEKKVIEFLEGLSVLIRAFIVGEEPKRRGRRPRISAKKKERTDER